MKTARRELRPGKTWPPGSSSFTGMTPIQEDFTGMRPLQENSSPPFIIRTENQDGSSACSRRLGKSLFWKNSKPIRSCVLGSTSHRNLRALPSSSALGCASGTTLGQRAQVSMLGRTSDAASNINLSTGLTGQ